MLPSSQSILRRISLLILVLLGSLGTSTAASIAREWNELLLNAIRRNVPNPPAHARNLFHTAAAMYNAWAAYDPVAIGYIVNEKVNPLPPDVEAARHEAISYAAYRVLRSRFFSGAGAPASLAEFDAKMLLSGYSTNQAQGAITNDPTPAELGKRIGQAILDWGVNDGFSQTNLPEVYNASVNPNMAAAAAMPVMGNNGEFPSRANMQLGLGIPLLINADQGYTVDTNPNFWQPLSLATSVSQNGIPVPGGIQGFIGVQSLMTTPFSLTRKVPGTPWMDIGPPARLSLPGNPSPTDAVYKANALDVLRFSSQLNDNTLVDISPGGYGDNPLGSDSGDGLELNPVTGQPYTANFVKKGDFARVLAEFWADGPLSETPPGHWHVLANQVSDNPLTLKKIRGVGPTLGDLEWDVKLYFSLAGSVHDAACAAWSLKRYYNGPRPITAIRYMGTMGQSSDINQLSYHPQGLPLEPGVVEVITAATVAPGQRHNLIWDVYTNSYHSGVLYIGKIAVFSWPGEHPNNAPAPSIATNQNLVRWMLAKDWLPFQRKTFNTPAFPGYVSGHSTFSRSAAEALTLITGSPNFPGGFGFHHYPANSMQIDLGPSADVELQWCTYYDAADQAGISRRYGGIHPVEDDHPARVMASKIGKSAYALAESYWNGTVQDKEILPTISRNGAGQISVTWKSLRGFYHRVISSPDMVNWSIEAASPSTISYSDYETWTDTTPGETGKYYRVLRSITPILTIP